jgi:DNA-binding response OmpR family regulator
MSSADSDPEQLDTKSDAASAGAAASTSKPEEQSPRGAEADNHSDHDHADEDLSGEFVGSTLEIDASDIVSSEAVDGPLAPSGPVDVVTAVPLTVTVTNETGATDDDDELQDGDDLVGDEDARQPLDQVSTQEELADDDNDDDGPDLVGDALDTVETRDVVHEPIAAASRADDEGDDLSDSEDREATVTTPSPVMEAKPDASGSAKTAQDNSASEMAVSSASPLPEGASGPLFRGGEVLLIDRDARVRDGFRKLFGTNGLVVTATESEQLAIELAKEKHFAVAVLDLDTPETNGGLRLMKAIGEHSPATALVLLTAKQTFSAAVKGFRAGATDVVAKSPENVKYLTEVVLEKCTSHGRSVAREKLFEQVTEIHEEFLQRLMDASRAKVEAEERAAGSSIDSIANECVVLVVDHNVNTARGLQQALTDEPFRIVSVQTGGEALDFVGQQQFQLALVTDDLPDLPSSMVAKSLRAESAQAIVLLFSHPVGDKPGRAVIIEPTQSIELITKLTQGSQLVEQIRELREAFLAKVKERRYLQAFRRDHYDFLRRYVELKQKLGLHSSDQGK